VQYGEQCANSNDGNHGGIRINPYIYLFRKLVTILHYKTALSFKFWHSRIDSILNKYQNKTDARNYCNLEEDNKIAVSFIL
jgi:hypothetical protein